MHRVGVALDNLYHRLKMVMKMTEDEISYRERQLEEEKKAAVRGYLPLTSMFEDRFLATMTLEKRNMFEDEWRRLAMDKERTDITSVSKADLEMYYPRDHHMFNDYYRPVNRNYYVDAKQQAVVAL